MCGELQVLGDGSRSRHQQRAGRQRARGVAWISNTRVASWAHVFRRGRVTTGPWSSADSAARPGKKNAAAAAAGGPAGAEPSEGIGCQLGEELEDADHEAGSAVHFKGSERAEHRAACTV